MTNKAKWKKKKNTSRPDVYKQRKREGTLLLLPSECFLNKLLPSLRDTLEFFSQILVNETLADSNANLVYFDHSL